MLVLEAYPLNVVVADSASHMILHPRPSLASAEGPPIQVHLILHLILLGTRKSVYIQEMGVINVF
jgi:hypothetical protein